MSTHDGASSNGPEPHPPPPSAVAVPGLGLGAPTLEAPELTLLAQIGAHWRQALGGHRRGRSYLPVNPDLVTPRAEQVLSRFERISGGGSFASSRPGELLATQFAGRPHHPIRRLGHRLARALIGPPLATTSLVEERLSRPVALAVLSSDALSSVAYGTEAMLGVLILAGSASTGDAVWISVAIVALMIAVGLSYRQTIRAYPKGGGSYIVASDNLGRYPGLVAAAGLMTDYILTVAVSVSAGVAAVTSAVPELRSVEVELGVLAIAVIVAINLRGLRQSGLAFAIPTYAFVLGVLALIAVGLVHAAGDGFHAASPPAIPATEGLGVFLILRAFASGCSAMTGIEAISDGVPAFQPPEWKNARATLSLMVALLATMFAGITVLVHLKGIVPQEHETVLSQVAASDFGHGVLYGLFQAATALILVLAANTAFNDFPRLCFFLARDGFAPRFFVRLGDRLAYTNGLLVLSGAAAILLIAFGGSTDSLIALYAVGVFLSFTLSQSGMVVRWWRRREQGFRRGLALNGAGALLSALVLVVVASTKFEEGAWIVLLLIPAMVLLFRRIRRHYDCAAKAVALVPLEQQQVASAVVPSLWKPLDPNLRIPSEDAEAPDELSHLTIVPLATLDRPSLRALAYAVAMGHPTLALHIAPDAESADRMPEYWRTFGDHVPLEILISPYRWIVNTIPNYLSAIHERRPQLTLTVVLPEIVSARAWQRPLHNQAARRLRAALRRFRGVAVVSVPFHLPPC